MARARKKAARKTSTRGKRASGTSRARSGSRQQDAIALLEADHREVEEIFEQFGSTRSDSRKQLLAQKICQALKVHTMIEEEIFYPAFYEATEDKEIHHEAEVEHEGAKKLIADIEASGPEDEYFDARISVLSEMIKHHVKEEESSDGMFGEARKSRMDLKALGEQLAQRKSELMSGGVPSGARAESQSRRRRPASGIQVNA